MIAIVILLLPFMLEDALLLRECDEAAFCVWWRGQSKTRLYGEFVDQCMFTPYIRILAGASQVLVFVSASCGV